MPTTPEGVPAEVAAARAALESSLADLFTRVQPAALRADATAAASTAAKDAAAAVTGKGLPEAPGRRKRAVSVLVAGAGVALLVSLRVAKRLRRR